MHKAGIVLYAKDYLKLSEFYQTVLAMELMEQDDEHVRLELPSSELVILQAPKHIADAIEITEPPALRSSTPIKAVYYVENIEKARKLAIETNGNVNDSETEWQFREATVCDGYDCEGNIFQLRCVPQ